MPGLGHIAGKALAGHPGVDKVSFTGSGPTGKDVMKSAAENLTSVCMELGGKSPALIFEDADIDNAVAQLQVGLFLNQGQCCCASSRIFVQVEILICARRHSLHCALCSLHWIPILFLCSDAILR